MKLFLAKVILKIAYMFRIPATKKHILKTWLESVFTDQYEVKKYLRRGMTVVDAGSYLGTFARFVRSKGAIVICFDPIINYALGDTNERKVLKIVRGVPAANHLEDSGMNHGENYSGETNVEVRTLDSFNIRPDFIKIDSEGYEARILKGATKTIQKYLPVIAMSAYHHAGDEEELPKALNKIAPYSCRVNRKLESVLICEPV